MEVLRPVGELVILSQATVPHKKFITALIRRPRGAMLPMEVDFSLGMRKYQVLITTDKGAFPKFRRDLGRYVLPIVDEVAELQRSSGGRYTHSITLDEKGKHKAKGDVPRIGRNDNKGDNCNSEVERYSPEVGMSFCAVDPVTVVE